MTLERLGGSLSVGWRPGTAMPASVHSQPLPVPVVPVALSPSTTLRSSLSAGTSVGVGLGFGSGSRKSGESKKGYAAERESEEIMNGVTIPTLRVNTITGVTTRTQKKIAVAQEQVRAWEEELERIEMQSRRSSIGMLRMSRVFGRQRRGEVVGGR